MSKIRLNFKQLLVVFVIICHISGHYVRADDDEPEEKAEKSPKHVAKLKPNKDLDNPSDGKVMKMVTETIREINPMRMIRNMDPDPLLQVKGVDIQKLKLPAGYIPDTFFDRFAETTKMSKQDMSKHFGGDIERKGEKDWVSIGGVLKLGKEKGLKLGDYAHFVGFDLATYEEQYEDYLLALIQRPVALIDEFLLFGLKQYTDQVLHYVKDNGGYMNSALHAYDSYYKTNYTKRVKEGITLAKSFNMTEQKMKWQHQWAIYQKYKEGEAKHYYQDTFGEGGTVQQYHIKVIKMYESTMRFLISLRKGDRFAAYLDMVGNALGPTGRSIAFIAYQPSITMANQIFGPLVLIPKIMASDEDIFDKVLALPPVIIQSTGGTFKPILMVVEPMVRLARFVLTSEYYKSLSAGLELAASYGINIWGGAFRPKSKHNLKGPGHEVVHKAPEAQGAQKPAGGEASPKAAESEGESAKKSDVTTKEGQSEGKADEEKRRRKRDTDDEEEETEKTQTEKTVHVDKPHFLTYDQRLADTYQGGPPPGGYKLGVKSDGKTDLDDEDIITRLLLAPDFILKAGGPVYVPFASVLAPYVRAMNTVFLGADGDVIKRMSEVPDIIRGVGLIGPMADIIQAMLPFIKTGYMYSKDQLTNSDLMIQTPTLVKSATTGVLYKTYKDPDKLIRSMLSFLEGGGGIIAMLKLQAKGRPPKTAPGAANSAKEEMKGEADFIVKSFGPFLGEWILGYIQGVGPIGSMNHAFMSGILGNVIDPVKFLITRPNLKNQPLKNIINAFDDLPRMVKSAQDRRELLTAVLGGQDPDVFNEIGINVEKLALNGIDPALLIGSGKDLLSPEAQKLVENEASIEKFGIKAQLLSKVDIDIKGLLEDGLLGANEQKLKDKGINMNSIFKRIMRNSIKDTQKVLESGIDIRAMLKHGIDPALVVAAGTGTISAAKLKQLGIESITEEAMKKIGLNVAKLQSKGIEANKLTKGGIDASKKEKDFGIDMEQLLFSVYTGLEPEKLIRAGIDIKMMASNGIDTKLLLTGGLKKIVNNNLSPPTLARIGINMKQVMAIGININLLTDAGVAILNPMNLIKVGVDPMRVMIASLSRHGLDALTAGPDKSISIEFVKSWLKIIQRMVTLTPRLREIPIFGPYLITPEGRWKGPAGVFFYKIIGIEGGGLLEFARKVMDGTVTREDFHELARLPSGGNKAIIDFKPRRVKADRAPVDEYVRQSFNLRIGTKHSAVSVLEKGSSIFTKVKSSKPAKADEESGEDASLKSDEDNASGGKSENGKKKSYFSAFPG